MAIAKSAQVDVEVPTPTLSLESIFDCGFVVGPLVSVIVTNYNYGRFIPECLRSIRNQSYQEFECIVVDDCSTDDSVAIIRQFMDEAQNHEKFHLVTCEKNGGQMNAFIEGFRASRGAFVVFVDADDTLFEDFVETHLNAHLNTCFVAGLSCSDEIIIDGKNALIAGTHYLNHGSVGAVTLSDDPPIVAATHPSWQVSWALADGVRFRQPRADLVYVDPLANKTRYWIWTSTSAVMFRRGVLEVALTDHIRDIRASADYYLFHFCHLIGGSLLIRSAHGCYRMHGSNNFAASAVIGGHAKRGELKASVTREHMWTRMSHEHLLHYERLVEVMGDARALRLLAELGELRSIFRVREAIGRGNVRGFRRFLKSLLAVKVKRRVGWIFRWLRFT